MSDEEIEILDLETIKTLTLEQMAEYLQYLHISGLTMKECADVFSCNKNDVVEFFRNERVYYIEETENQTQEWKKDYITFLYFTGKTTIAISGFMKKNIKDIESFLFSLGYKYCIRCQCVHSFNYFFKNKRMLFGLRSHCSKTHITIKNDQDLYNEYVKNIQCIQEFAGKYGYGWNRANLVVDILREIDPNIKLYKRCNGHCNKIKSFDEFYYNEASVLKLQPRCNICSMDVIKKNYRKDPEKAKLRAQKYYFKNLEKRKEHDKFYKSENKDKIKEQRHKYNMDHREEQKEYDKFYKSENREKIREYDNERRRTNINVRLNDNMSGQIRYFLFANGSGKNGNSWKNLVNYTVDELKEHLEKQFDENMSWINYGTYWQIDHIVPKAFFTIESYNDLAFKLCWSLENLRPLECTLNYIKKDIISNEYDNVDLANKFARLITEAQAVI